MKEQVPEMPYFKNFTTTDNVHNNIFVCYIFVYFLLSLYLFSKGNRYIAVDTVTGLRVADWDLTACGGTDFYLLQTTSWILAISQLIQLVQGLEAHVMPPCSKGTIKVQPRTSHENPGGSVVIALLFL
jgi:hypothetical protein